MLLRSNKKSTAKIDLIYTETFCDLCELFKISKFQTMLDGPISAEKVGVCFEVCFAQGGGNSCSVPSPSGTKLALLSVDCCLVRTIRPCGGGHVTLLIHFAREKTEDEKKLSNQKN